MTDAALSKISQHTPLPEVDRWSLSVAISVYQGKATVSVVQRTSEPGGRPRFLPLRNLEITEAPETYYAACYALFTAILDVRRRLVLGSSE